MRLWPTDIWAYRESLAIVFSRLRQAYGGPREEPIYRGELSEEFKTDMEAE